MRSILYLLLAFFFFSCQKNQNSKFEDSFKYLGEYKLKLDRFTSPVEEYIQYLPDWKGKEAFAFHVRSIEQIKIYDLKGGDLIENLAYSSLGPNPFQGIYDFHIVNEDSIFLNKRYLYKTYLVNKKYEVLKELKFLDENIEVDQKTRIPINGDTFLPVFTHNRIFKLLEGKVFLTGSPDKNARSPSYFNSNSLILSFDLETEKIDPLLGFQEKMKNKAWGVLHSRVYADFDQKSKMFFISYEGDENAYVADENLNVLSKFETKPEDNFTDILPIPEEAIQNEDAYLQHFNNQAQFGSILNDPFRNMIYRIVLEPNPEYGKQFLRDPLYKPRNMIIMAFDKNSFEKKGEIKLGQNREGVYLDRCFVNEKGINVAFVNLKDEDHLYFKTYSLE